MRRLLLVLLTILLLSACNAKTDKDPISTADSGATPASLTEAAGPAQPGSEPDSLSGLVKPLVTFIELGAESCIPCKMMQPVMKEIAAEYEGLVKVVFYDLYKEREAGQKYRVRVMPTQVFLDAEGREFSRHEGFYPKDQLKAMLDAYLAEQAKP